MTDVVFVTGNQNKADYLAKYLGYPIEHIKLDLEEIQSLDLKEIVQHKVRQAYEQIKRPVLVEDVSLEFSTLGKLPGPFIKFFLEQIALDKICGLVGQEDRGAIARCVFGYFDGSIERYFEGSIAGSIPLKAAGSKGYGFDQIFIPEGYSMTRAELDEEDDRKTYTQMKPFKKVKEFLDTLSS